MEITFDPAKREWTLRERGIDFADAGRVFEGPTFTQLDDRFDYPEPGYQTYGLISERLVLMAWTPVEGGMRVISMRRCNDREQRKFAGQLG